MIDKLLKAHDCENERDLAVKIMNVLEKSTNDYDSIDWLLDIFKGKTPNTEEKN